MKTDKVLTRFAAASTDEFELRRLARSVGNELPRQRLDVLRSVRANLARTPICDAGNSVDSESYAKGYVASMLDVMAEYETSVAQQYDAATIAEMVSHMDSELTEGMVQGIRVAVGLFQHFLANASSSTDVLEAIAEDLLHDPHIAAQAVGLWAEEARDAGLISERDTRDAVRESDSIPTPIFAAGSEAVAAPALEQRAALATMTHRDLIDQPILPDLAFQAQEQAPQPGATAIPLFAANDNGGLAARIQRDNNHDDEPNSPNTI